MIWWMWALILVAAIAALLYWFVFRPVDLPGPAPALAMARYGAGEHQDEELPCFHRQPCRDRWCPGYDPANFEEWDDLDPDTQADQLISEWQCVCAETSSRNCPVHCDPETYETYERMAAVEDHVTAWLDDPDLIVWDAKQQAARCWEILHIEFPRLRAELGIAA